MKLDKQQLLELQDYINMLDEQVGLSSDTMDDLSKAIDKELDKIQRDKNLIDHFDNMNT